MAIRRESYRYKNLSEISVRVDMLRFAIYSCTIILVLAYTACDVINPEEEVPSYIHIDDIAFYVTEPITQGTASHKITDAWVYIDDHPLGVFELPATFPVLYVGKHTLKVRAGVKNTGFSRIRLAYPFYDFYINDSTFELFRDSIVDISPSVMYFPETIFAWIEDFEDIGISIDSTNDSDVNMVRVTSGNDVFEGNASGAIYMTPDKSFYRGLTTDKFELPQSGKAVFLEMDYKNNVDLQLRLWSNNGSQSDEIELITLTPKQDSNGQPLWGKIYIEVTNAILDMSSAENYQIEFITDGGTSGGEVFIDNLKLLHQP